jgi:hypothetical protein
VRALGSISLVHRGRAGISDDRGVWNIVYYRTLLGKIDERTLLITGV